MSNLTTGHTPSHPGGRGASSTHMSTFYWYAVSVHSVAMHQASTYPAEEWASSTLGTWRWTLGIAWSACPHHMTAGTPHIVCLWWLRVWECEGVRVEDVQRFRVKGVVRRLWEHFSYLLGPWIVAKATWNLFLHNFMEVTNLWKIVSWNYCTIYLCMTKILSQEWTPPPLLVPCSS